MRCGAGVRVSGEAVRAPGQGRGRSRGEQEVDAYLLSARHSVGTMLSARYPTSPLSLRRVGGGRLQQTGEKKAPRTARSPVTHRGSSTGGRQRRRRDSGCCACETRVRSCTCKGPRTCGRGALCHVPHFTASRWAPREEALRDPGPALGNSPLRGG